MARQRLPICVKSLAGFKLNRFVLSFRRAYMYRSLIGHHDDDDDDDDDDEAHYAVILSVWLALSSFVFF